MTMKEFLMYHDDMLNKVILSHWHNPDEINKFLSTDIIMEDTNEKTLSKYLFVNTIGADDKLLPLYRMGLDFEFSSCRPEHDTIIPPIYNKLEIYNKSGLIFCIVDHEYYLNDILVYKFIETETSLIYDAYSYNTSKLIMRYINNKHDIDEFYNYIFYPIYKLDLGYDINYDSCKFGTSILQDDTKRKLHDLFIANYKISKIGGDIT